MKAAAIEPIAIASEKAKRRTIADWKATRACVSAASRGVPGGIAGVR